MRIAVASDHLIALDPSQSGKAILGPLGVVLISVGVYIVIVSTTEIINIALTPPEDRAQLIAKIWPMYTMTINSFGDIPKVSQSGELGKYLLDQYNAEVSK